jgi:hypothetical protein
MNRTRKGRLRIIPVIAKPCNVPDRLIHLLYVNFVGRYEDALDDLLTKGFGVSPKPLITPKGGPPSSAPKTLASVPTRGIWFVPGGVVIAVAVVMLFLIGSFIFGAFAQPTLSPTSIAEIATTRALPTSTNVVIAPTKITLVTNPTKTPTATAITMLLTSTPYTPPGVYVVGMESVPKMPTFGDNLAFKVTFLNTTGNILSVKWFVKIYECPDQCLQFATSIGESVQLTSDVTSGVVELLSRSWQSSKGRCAYVAVPQYLTSYGQAVPFLTTSGSPFYYSFDLCQ